MPSGTFGLATWSDGLVGLVFTAFAIGLAWIGYVRTPYRLASSALFAAVVLSALWGWLRLVGAARDDEAFFYGAALADIARYAAWYLCLLSVLGHVGRESLSRPASRAFVATASALVLIALGAALAGGADATPGREGRVTLLAWMALAVFGMVLVEQFYRNVHEDSRWNAKPLCLGLSGMFLFDVYLFSQSVLFGKVDEASLGIRGIVHLLTVPLLMLSISRRRDWISRLRVSRKAAFHSATLLIAGLYLVFVSTVGYYVRFFGGEWGRVLQIAVVVAALVALMIVALSGSVRAKLRVQLGKHFFQYRYDYREEWLRFTQTLSGQNSPQDMGQQVIRGLADMLESPAGQLWTRTSGGGGGAAFANSARWNMPPRGEVEPAGSPFCEFIVRSGWVIDLAQFRNAPQQYDGLVLPAWLLATDQAWLVVPLRVADDLTGFVVLATPRTAVDVNWEVNDLLKTAGRQAASFLAQMQATEALLEVRKFDAFNRMSAFVVHDLKNIVTQLTLMMKNAKRLQSNPEFQQDMLMTVENSLERMRQLMLQLREGATPAGVAFGVDLPTVLRRIAASTAGKGRVLDLEAMESLTIRGDDQRIERVIGHVVQNALDATERGGRVAVRLDRVGGRARIEVADTGQGMSKEFVRDRLFKPFQTTKSSGMGIGAYESSQYVQELGGSIHVDSEPGLGTRVTLLLPLFEAQNESDLHMLKAS